MTKRSRSIPSISLLKFLSSQLLFLSGCSQVVSASLVSPHATQAFVPNRTTLVSSPATSAASRITAAPNHDPQRIFARQATASNFCAYENGDIASPISCATGYTCQFLDLESAAWGCCNKNTCTNAPRTCIEANNAANPCQFVDCVSLYTSILTCSGNKPGCVTYVLHDDPYSLGITYGPQSFSCGPVATVINVKATALGQSGAQNTDSANSDDSSSDDSSDENANPGATPTKSSNSKNNNNNSDNNDNDNNNNGKRLDIGTIIGIVVAAVGVFATVMVGLFPRQMTKCLTCGRRPKKEHSNEEMRKMALGYIGIGGNGQENHGEAGQPLYHGTQPMGIGLQPMPGQGQQMAWNQQQWQGQPQQQWGNTGYDAGYGAPPPVYQQQQGYMPQAQYAHAPNPAYQKQEQSQPFLYEKP